MPLLPRTPEERYEFYKSDLYGEGDSGTFQIERLDRDGKFFSQAPLEDLFDNVRLLIGSRMMRYFEKQGQTPKKMVVRVEIDFE